MAQLRRMQIESEQFRYFEDQLRRQELANQKDGAALKVQEQTDGTCLSRTPKNHVGLGPSRSKQAVPINKPTSTLGAVQSESASHSALQERARF